MQHHCMLAGSVKCIWIHTPRPYLLCPVALPPARPLHPNHPILVLRPEYCDLYQTVGDSQCTWQKDCSRGTNSQLPFLTFSLTCTSTPSCHSPAMQGIISAVSSTSCPYYNTPDDTCLTASCKANCQAMLNTTQKWLDWSLPKAKALKCAAISICGQTRQCTNPHLSIFKSLSFHFLRSPSQCSTLHRPHQRPDTDKLE